MNLVVARSKQVMESEIDHEDKHRYAMMLNRRVDSTDSYLRNCPIT